MRSSWGGRHGKACRGHTGRCQAAATRCSPAPAPRPQQCEACKRMRQSPASVAGMPTPEAAPAGCHTRSQLGIASGSETAVFSGLEDCIAHMQRDGEMMSRGCFRADGLCGGRLTPPRKAVPVASLQTRLRRCMSSEAARCTRRRRARRLLIFCWSPWCRDRTVLKSFATPAWSGPCPAERRTFKP